MGAGDREAKKSRELLRQNVSEVNAIGLPDLEAQKIYLEQLQSAGQLTPELEQAILQQSSAMEGVSTDPRLKSQQMSALEQLAGISETGMSPADQAAFELARRGAAQENQAMQGQILQQMQARGQGGSGAELIARLTSSQKAADSMQAAQLEQAKLQQAARMQALNQVGALSGSIREQDFGEATKIAQARDLINQFNAQSQQGVQQRNVSQQNQAQQANLQNQQNILNQNAALRNQQQQFNKGLVQQQFQNQLQKQGLKTGANQQLSGSYAQSAAQQGALTGQLLGAGLAIAGGMIGGPAGAAAGGAAGQAVGSQSSAMNFDPTKYGNQA